VQIKAIARGQWGAARPARAPEPRALLRPLWLGESLRRPAPLPWQPQLRFAGQAPASRNGGGAAVFFVARTGLHRPRYVLRTAARRARPARQPLATTAEQSACPPFAALAPATPAPWRGPPFTSNGQDMDATTPPPWKPSLGCCVQPGRCRLISIIGGRPGAPDQPNGVSLAAGGALKSSSGPVRLAPQ